jgi:hypothetical protein
MIVDEIEPTNYDPTPMWKVATRPVSNTVQPKLHIYDIPPTNNQTYYDLDFNTIQFNINNSSNLLDPFTFFIDIEVENPNEWPLQLDGSAHSLISKITLTSNGQIIEQIDNYDEYMFMYSDLYYDHEIRANRRENEGYGDNEWGTNETMIPGTLQLEYGKAGYIVTEEEKKVLKIENMKHANEIHPNNLLEWDHVINGKLSPFPYPESDLYKLRNKRNFRLPVMLKLMGLGQGVDNYKFFPLEILGYCTITIVLNPDAFFVPMERTLKTYITAGKDAGNTRFIWVNFLINYF